MSHSDNYLSLKLVWLIINNKVTIIHLKKSLCFEWLSFQYARLDLISQDFGNCAFWCLCLIAVNLCIFSSAYFRLNVAPCWSRKACYLQARCPFLQNHCETGMLLHNFDSLHKSHPPQYFICILMLSNINYSRLEHVEVNKRPFRRCCHPRQQVLGVSSFAACGPTAIYMKMSSKFGAEVHR